MKEASLTKPDGRVFLAAILLLLAFVSPKVSAQVLVDLSIKRSLFIAYEPLLATVKITNLSGNPLLLADVEGKKWFGFQIETLDGRPIPPSDPDYELEPMRIGPGESISRTINLTQLYPMGDFGSYRIRASIYAAELASYFSSPPLTVEITEGRTLWQQTVGVPGQPDGGLSSRTITLLSHRLPDRTDLYLRIANKASGIVYCTHRLGDFLSYGKPDVMLDATNTIHVLQNAQPRLFVYSKVGLNGKILDRISIDAPKGKPALQRTREGSVVVVGGRPFDPHASPTPSTVAKLSDRPVPIPFASAVPSPTAKKRSVKDPPPTSNSKPEATPAKKTAVD